MAKLAFWNLNDEINSNVPFIPDGTGFKALWQGNQLSIEFKATQGNLWDIDINCNVGVTESQNSLRLESLSHFQVNKFLLLGNDIKHDVEIKVITGDLVIESGSLRTELIQSMFSPIGQTFGGILKPFFVNSPNEIKLHQELRFKLEKSPTSPGVFVPVFTVKKNLLAENKVIIDDNYLNLQSKNIFENDLTQILPLTQIALAPTGTLCLDFTPVKKFSNSSETGNLLYINPYVFKNNTRNTSPITGLTEEQKREEEIRRDTTKSNFVAYQYALVNGVLRYDYSLQKWLWVSGALLVLNYTDQDTNPLALAIDKLEMVHRSGVHDMHSFEIDTRTWQLLNRGITFVSEQTLRVIKIDPGPSNINIKEKNAQLYSLSKKENSFSAQTKPYWLNKGRVKLLDKAPAEIYGLTKGVVYKNPGTELNVSFTTQRVKAIDLKGPAEILFFPPNLAEEPIIYHKTAMNFKPGSLIPATMVEEKESVLSGTGQTTVQTRDFKNSASKDLILPATNYKIAATNISDPGGKIATAIPKVLGQWMDDLKKDIESFSAKTEKLEHSSGFRRLGEEDLRMNHLFSKAPFKALRLNETAPEITILKDKSLIDDPAPVSTSSTTQPTSPYKPSSEPAKFNHGKDNGTTVPFASVQKTNGTPAVYTASAPAADELVKILARLRKFRRVWNQSCDTLNTPNSKAATIQFIKYYYQKGPDELRKIIASNVPLNDKLDQVKNIREKLEANDKRLAAMLADLRTMMNGNLHALNGLGAKVKLVRSIVNSWTPAKFEDFWKQEWGKWVVDIDRVTEEEQKIIFELLNQYYYPAERKTITELAHFKKTFNEQKEATDIMTFLVNNGLDVKDALSDIEQFLDSEIEDLANNVNLEITNVVTHAWQAADKYFAYLEELWNNAEEEANDFLKEIDALKIKSFDDRDKTVLQVVWAFRKLALNQNELRSKVTTLWNQFRNDEATFGKKITEHYRAQYLAKFEQLHSKFGSYFSLSTYKNILLSLATGGAMELIDFLKNILKDKILRKLEDELRGQFETVITGASGNAAAAITDCMKLLASFEEDILVLCQQAVSWKPVVNIPEVTDFLQKAVQTDAPQKILAIYNSNRAAFNALKQTIEDISGEQFLEGEQQITAFVNQHWHYIQDAIAQIKEFETATDELVNQVEGIYTDFTNVARLLTQSPTTRKVLVDYFLRKYHFSINLEDLRVQPPQYVVYGKNIAYNVNPAIVNAYNEIIENLFNSKFSLCRFGGDNKRWNMVKGDTSVFILKLGSELSIEEIVDDIEANNKKAAGSAAVNSSPFGWDASGPFSRAEFFSQLPNELKRKDWRGIFIVRPLADISKDSFLRTLLGIANFKMPYAAIGGKESKNWNDLDVYARIFDLATPAPASSLDKDVDFRVIKFDATIKNTCLVAGEIETQLTVKDLFGKKDNPANRWQVISIMGSLPPKEPSGKASAGFEFSAKLKTPATFPINFAFFDSVTISKIRAASRNGKCFLEIDARLKVKEYIPTMHALESGNNTVDGEEIDFKNFRIEIPAMEGGTSSKMGWPRPLNFDMQAIEFLLKGLKPMSLAGMEILPRGLGYIRENAGEILGNSYMWIRGKPDNVQKMAYAKVDIDFGCLSALGGTDGQSLKLSGILGYTIDGLDFKNLHFGISGGDFKNVHFSLFRFIELEMAELKIQADVPLADSQKATVILGRDAQLKLLNWSVFGKNGKVTFLFLSESAPGNNKGFYFLYENKDGGFLDIKWVLIGKGIGIEGNELMKLLTSDSPENHEYPPTDSKTPDAGQSFEFKENLTKLSLTGDNTWLLGASFAIGGIFDRCAFILHDKHFYGIYLASSQPWFKEIFGTDRLAVAYMPGKTKREDRFRVEFSLPFLNFLGTLNSGMIAIEFGVNKDLLFDFGYPWRVGNRYQWDRTFRSIAGIYEMKFGFYFEKRTEYTASENQIVTIGAGIGFYYGYHIGGGTPIAWAEAGIGITVILAGQVKLLMKGTGGAFSALDSSIVEITVTGVIGIYAYAQGGINYWVISASFRAEIQAALSGTLHYLPHGGSSLVFAATVSALFSASARVKLGFVSIEVSISGSVDFGIEGNVALN